jgi:hypothetical protein
MQYFILEMLICLEVLTPSDKSDIRIYNGHILAISVQKMKAIVIFELSYNLSVILTDLKNTDKRHCNGVKIVWRHLIQRD